MKSSGRSWKNEKKMKMKYAQRWRNLLQMKSTNGLSKDTFKKANAESIMINLTLFVSLYNRLTDKFSSELKKYQLICFYCGTPMDDKTINKKCTVNTRIPEGCKLIVKLVYSVDYFCMKIYLFLHIFEKHFSKKSWGLHNKNPRSEIPWESEALFCST